MNWRRGFLLAGIHLVVAGTLIVWLEARDAKYIKAHADDAVDSSGELVTLDADTAPKGTEQESMTVTFDPCWMWGHNGAQESAMQMVNLPAFLLTEWRVLCPARWTLSGILEGGNRTRMWIQPKDIQRKVDLGFCLLIVLQWVLVGGLPLRRPQRWWMEPGALITACAVVAGCFAIIPFVDEFARVPASIALFAWLWWFGLLVWTGLRAGWRVVRRRAVHAG